MLPGELEGILIGIAICGLLVLFGVYEVKKEKKKIEQIKGQISSEDLEKLKQTKFEYYEENNNFLVNTSYIYEIVEEENRVEVRVIFYQGEFATKNESDFIIDKVYITKEEFAQKGLKVGQFVQTQHNTINRVKFKISKII